jgi:hypothetical protein
MGREREEEVTEKRNDKVEGRWRERVRWEGQRGTVGGKGEGIGGYVEKRCERESVGVGELLGERSGEIIGKEVM